MSFESDNQIPKVLYHASTNREIEEFEPRREGFRDPEEGPVVFATPDKAYASMFLVKSRDEWTNKGRFGDGKGNKGPWHVIVGDKKRFLEADKGGVIYSLPVDSFEFHKDRNMSELEWTSKTSVKPVGKEVFESGFQAMKDMGIEVYFVDAKTWKAIQESVDHGHQILQSLKPEE